MALIPGTYNEVRYTYYRDIVVMMSDVQKVQAALIPDGVDPTLFEVLVSEVTSSGSEIYYYNYYPTYATLPVHSQPADYAPLISCQLSGSDTVTGWLQFRITVRLKTNHADYATGIIKLVPTAEFVSLNVGTGWSGSWTGIDSSPGGGNIARSELELLFKSSGTWEVNHYRGDGRTKTLQGSGIWLPTGRSASEFAFAFTSSDGVFSTTLRQGVYLNIPSTGKHSANSWARMVGAGETNDQSVWATMVIGIKDLSSGQIITAAVEFENTVLA